MKTIEEIIEKFAKNLTPCGICRTAFDAVDCEVNIVDCIWYKEIYNALTEVAELQKEFDEEVRLKKCDDMTKAEYDREVAFADWYSKKGKSTPTFSDAIEWARKETIDKACKWLRIATQCGVHPCSGNGFVENFRKAMELKDDKDNDDEVNEGQALLYAVNKTEERVKKMMIKKARRAFDKACSWLNTFPWYPAVLDEFIKTMED